MTSVPRPSTPSTHAGDWRWLSAAALASAAVAVAFAVTAYAVTPVLVPVLVLATGVLAACYSRPAWGVGLALACVPLELVSLPLPSGALTPTEAVFALVGTSWVLHALEGRPVARPAARDLPVLALLLIFLLGATVAIEPAPVLRTCALWTLFYLVYLHARSFTPSQIRGVVLAFAAGAAVLGAIGLVTVLASGEFDVGGGGRFTAGRATGTFGDPNYYAAMLALAVLPALALLLHRPARAWWLAPAVALGAAAIVFSLSRGGMLNLGFGLLVLLLWRRARTALLAIVVVVVALTALDANPVVGSQEYLVVTERFGSLTNSDLEAVSRRPDIWRTAIDVTAENPLIGVGLNQFRFAASRRGLTEYGAPIENVHNMPLSFAAETGLLGLVAFLVLVGQLLARNVRALRSREALPFALALGFLAALVGFLVQGLTLMQLRVPVVAAAFFAILGMVTALSDRAAAQPPREAPGGR